MAEPKAHTLHTTQAGKVADDKRPAGDDASHDIAEAAAEATPKGVPDAGRHATETAVKHK